MCVCVLVGRGSAPQTTPSNSQIPADWIQLSSDTICLQRVSDSTAWGLSPTRRPPSLAPDAGHTPHVTCASNLTSHRLEVLMTISLSPINLFEQLRELRETLMFTGLLKDVIKSMNQQPNKGMCRVRSWTEELLSFCGVWVARGSILVPQAWKLSEKGPKHCSLGLLWRVHYIVLIDSVTDLWLIPSTAPLPSLQVGVEGVHGTSSSNLLITWVALLKSGPCPWVGLKATFINKNIPISSLQLCSIFTNVKNIFIRPTISEKYIFGHVTGRSCNLGG